MSRLCRLLGFSATLSSLATRFLNTSLKAWRGIFWLLASQSIYLYNCGSHPQNHRKCKGQDCFIIPTFLVWIVEGLCNIFDCSGCQSGWGWCRSLYGFALHWAWFMIWIIVGESCSRVHKPWLLLFAHFPSILIFLYFRNYSHLIAWLLQFPISISDQLQGEGQAYRLYKV